MHSHRTKTAVNDILTHTLDRGESIRLSVNGWSMAPLIRPGDTLTIEPATSTRLRPGDIVLRKAEEDWVVHRLLAVRTRNGTAYAITRGDSADRVDPSIPLERVMGKVTGIDRKNGGNAAIAGHGQRLGAAIRCEHEALFRCAEAHIDSARADCFRSALQEDIDWPHLVGVAQQHGMACLLYSMLKSTCPRTVIPDGAMDRLQDSFYASTANNMLLFRELLRVLELFERHAITCVPLRGPVLSLYIHGSLALRPSCDLDILVHKKDVHKAKALLTARKYRTVISLPETPRSLRDHNSLLFVSGGEQRGIGLDLHWDFFPQHFFPGGLDDYAWDFRAFSCSEMVVPCFRPEDLLLILCIHGAKHAWDRLMWICDIAKLLQAHSGLDWERVLKKANALRCERRLHLGLLLAHELLGASVPEEVMQRVETDRRAGRLAVRIAERLFCRTRGLHDKFERDRLLTAMHDRTWNRVKYAHHLFRAYLRQVLTPNEHDYRRLRLPRYLSFCHYLLKPFRLAGDYLPYIRPRFRTTDPGIEVRNSIR